MNWQRTKKLNDKDYASGPIIYWMSRDHRVHDNWALIAAQELAKKHDTSIAVVFCLRKEFDQNTERMLDFMLTGLEEVDKELQKYDIPMYFLYGDPAEEIPKFVKKEKIGGVIADFNPLKWKMSWDDKIAKALDIPFVRVDAHNIVPCWVASPKQQFGAYTLRPKIHHYLEEYLENFSNLHKQKADLKPEKIDWKDVREQIKSDDSVKPVDWLKPGEKAAHRMLQEFIDERLATYDEERNDPTKHAQSEISPYLHFGHIASQRIALEIEKVKGHTASKKAYLEELIVRKELSDNYCFYNENYDNPKGYPDWAKKTHDEHASDKRDYTYTRQELEDGETHDDLWNAAQHEMRERGKMHGYLRMYWAKKIFEWSQNAAEAQKHAIYLNDKYFLDGRDPNGYTGIAWSMGGVHDRAWFERAVFGKIRYMNYNGAKSKFDVKKYIAMNS